MIALIKLNQRTTLVHHIFVSFCPATYCCCHVLATHRSFYYELYRTECMPYMLGSSQRFAFNSICFWPNGLWQVGNMWEKNGKKQKHNWGVRGPSVVPAWKLQSLPWNSQCLPWNLYCLPWSPKPQKSIRNHSRSKNVGSSWWMPDVLVVTCCDHVWKHFKVHLVICMVDKFG